MVQHIAGSLVKSPAKEKFLHFVWPSCTMEVGSGVGGTKIHRMVSQDDGGTVKSPLGSTRLLEVWWICFTVLYFALYKTFQDHSEEDGQVELCRKEVRSTAKEFGQDRRLL